MLPYYVSLAYRVTYWHRPRKVNWCQIWPANTQGSRFSQLALCIQQWLSRQTIKLRRGNIVWDLKKCRGKGNVDLQMYGINVYRMYRDRIWDFTNILTYPCLELTHIRYRDNECRLYYTYYTRNETSFYGHGVQTKSTNFSLVLFNLRDGYCTCI